MAHLHLLVLCAFEFVGSSSGVSIIFPKFYFARVLFVTFVDAQRWLLSSIAAHDSDALAPHPQRRIYFCIFAVR